ncbi:MAG: apolipoprotein N-acyltransferase [Holosporales bacterium]|nr:apolipoprotein N-acyltransferase [Holosporales bacterium]
MTLKNALKITNNFLEILLATFPKLSLFLAGGLAKFCFCKEYSFPILAWPMFAVLLTVLINSKLNKSFSIGFCFGTGYFGSSLYWIAESFKCVGLGNYGYVAVVLLVLYLSIYSAAACFLTKRFSRTRLNFLILFASFWTLMEYARGIIFTGFPWNLIGYATYNIPFFPQIADIFGVYGVSFIFVLIVAFLTNKKTMPWGLAIFSAILIYGYYKINIYDGYIVPKEQCLTRIVQPSIKQEDKMDLTKFKKNLQKHITLSGLSSNIYKGKMLIAWPEAAINIPTTPKNGILNYVSSKLPDDTYIIAGRDKIEQNRVYNGACVIGKKEGILQSYEKRHLLPFGEFIPEFLLNLGLRKVTPGIVNFTKGTSTRTIKIDGFNKFDVVICYEAVFPGEILDDPDSGWILNITNDAWFKDSDGPAQHLTAACFRAIEEGRAVVRVANNGISCVIDCNGRFQQRLETDEVGKIDVNMPSKYCSTFFSKHKNKTVLILITVLIISLLIRGYVFAPPYRQNA